MRKISTRHLPTLRKMLATIRYNSETGHRLRADFSDGDPDIEAPYHILKHTLCAAVFTENGFMDSEVSLKFLESEAGKKAIVALHVEGIVEFVRKFQP